MIDPATGWFEIKQYDDKKSITVANIVEQEWLTTMHYARRQKKKGCD
jgi:tRNA A37 N6-isopentenylltransferase MiaA